VGRSTKQVLDAGGGLVPEDRTHDALVADFSVAENLVLDQHDRPPFGSALAMRPRPIRQNAERLIPEFDIRTESAGSAVSTLAGGNHEKVVIAQAMNPELALLVASQPIRGADVVPIEILHRRVHDESDNGTPVEIVSAELDEGTQLADRITEMYGG